VHLFSAGSQAVESLVKMHAFRIFVVLAGALLPAVSAHSDDLSGQTIARRAVRPNPPNGHWIDTWASMPQLTEPANLPPAPFVCRHQNVHMSLLT
jgi:hypothetical protein